MTVFTGSWRVTKFMCYDKMRRQLDKMHNSLNLKVIESLWAGVMSKQAQCCFLSLLGGPNSQVYLCRVRKEIRIMSNATHHKLLISKNYLNDIISIN